MFKDRKEAGELLAKKLKKYKNKKNVVVVGLTRGGVLVSYVIAQLLNLPHDILVVKKIGSPYNPELAIGAVGPKSTVYWDIDLCKELSITTRIKNQESRIMNQERKERERILRGKRKPLDINEKIAILVDDGVATGATAIAASLYLKKQKVKSILFAIPIISKDTLEKVRTYFDRIIALQVVNDFQAVGQFYQNFPQVSDNEVIVLLSL